MQALGLKLGAIALCSLPVVAGWFILSVGLGRAQERRSAQRAAPVKEAEGAYSFDSA
jgi:AAA family ATP:ADP antiporter